MLVSNIAINFSSLAVFRHFQQFHFIVCIIQKNICYLFPICNYSINAFNNKKLSSRYLSHQKIIVKANETKNCFFMFSNFS